MDWLLLVLRLLHIGGGVFWVGAAFTFFLFVAPSTLVLPPPNRKAFMDQLLHERAFPQVISVASTITVVAGIGLYWIVSGGLNSTWVTSPTGLGFTAGGLAALAAWVLGFAVISPTVKAVSRLGGELVAAGRPPTPEEGSRMEALAGRLRKAGIANLVLLGAAVLFMAISRYLR